jgi:hypothetical protein
LEESHPYVDYIDGETAELHWASNNPLARGRGMNNGHRLDHYAHWDWKKTVDDGGDSDATSDSELPELVTISDADPENGEASEAQVLVIHF